MHTYCCESPVVVLPLSTNNDVYSSSSSSSHNERTTTSVVDNYRDGVDYVSLIAAMILTTTLCISNNGLSGHFEIMQCDNEHIKNVHRYLKPVAQYYINNSRFDSIRMLCSTGWSDTYLLASKHIDI